jgi:hypothetical protein
VFSHDHPGIRCNLPGDPFTDDGVYTPDSRSYGIGSPGLMSYAMEMRNRYGWHSAEFARVVGGLPPLYVKHKDFAEYKVPPHADAPKRNYSYWPISEAIDQAQERTANSMSCCTRRKTVCPETRRKRRMKDC